MVTSTGEQSFGIEIGWLDTTTAIFWSDTGLIRLERGKETQGKFPGTAKPELPTATVKTKVGKTTRGVITRVIIVHMNMRNWERFHQAMLRSWSDVENFGLFKLAFCNCLFDFADLIQSLMWLAESLMVKSARQKMLEAFETFCEL